MSNDNFNNNCQILTIFNINISEYAIEWLFNLSIHLLTVLTLLNFSNLKIISLASNCTHLSAGKLNVKL